MNRQLKYKGFNIYIDHEKDRHNDRFVIYDDTLNDVVHIEPNLKSAFIAVYECVKHIDTIDR